MPRRRKRVKRNRQRAARRAAGRLSALPRSETLQTVLPHEAVRALTSLDALLCKLREPDSPILVGSRGGEEKKSPPPADLSGLRALFKADQPYTTRVSLQASMTCGSGVVNQQFSVSNIATTAEWSAVNALFDEFFVHTMTFTYMPINESIGGIGSAGTQAVVSTTAATTVRSAAGLIAVSLFNVPAFYAGAGGMSNNPTRRLFSSARPARYVWRNNVRFDPHGIGLNLSTATGWQGWNAISDTAGYGGAIQIRAMNDQALNGGGTWTPGDYELRWEVSFRARA